MYFDRSCQNKGVIIGLTIGILVLILCMFFCYFLRFLFFFVFVTEKDGKTCFNAEKYDFDQQTACKAG